MILRALWRALKIPKQVNVGARMLNLNFPLWGSMTGPPSRVLF